MVHWFIGPLVHWSIGPLVHWFIGSLVHWFIGSLVHWFIGSLVHWFIGPLVHWSIGPLVHWFIGSLVREIMVRMFVHWFTRELAVESIRSSARLLIPSPRQLIYSSAYFMGFLPIGGQDATLEDDEDESDDSGVYNPHKSTPPVCIIHTRETRGYLTPSCVRACDPHETSYVHIRMPHMHAYTRRLG